MDTETTTSPPPKQAIRNTFVVGKCVYRKWRYPDQDDYWYETYFVKKITAQQVHVQAFMGHNIIILKRRLLERLGMAVNHAHQAVFYVEMPEEYRKTTIGYLLASGPREILNLPPEFTPEQLEAAYNCKARETHPDRAGSIVDAEEFRKVQAAYEHLKNGSSLGQIIRLAKETQETPAP